MLQRRLLLVELRVALHQLCILRLHTLHLLLLRRTLRMQSAQLGGLTKHGAPGFSMSRHCLGWVSDVRICGAPKTVTSFIHLSKAGKAHQS